MLGLNLNLWKTNSPQLNGMNNIFNPNLPQNDLASSILGMYGNRPLQQNPSNLTSILPNSQTFHAENNNSLPTSLGNLDSTKPEQKRTQESSKMNTEDKEPEVHKFIEKPIDQLIIPENPKNSLQHAIVDTESGHIYFLSPVTTDSLNINKNRNSLTGNFNGLDLFGNSPALNSRSWTSPTLNANSIFNNPLNQQLASLGLGRSAISPNMGLIHDSPDLNRVFLNQNFKTERRSNDWTPETTAKTPLSILNSQSVAINQLDKDKALGVLPGNSGSVFSKRPLMGDKSKNNSFSTSESSKFDSPSSFLESNQTRALSFRSGEPAKVPVRQLM